MKRGVWLLAVRFIFHRCFVRARQWWTVMIGLLARRFGDVVLLERLEGLLLWILDSFRLRSHFFLIHVAFRWCSKLVVGSRLVVPSLFCRSRSKLVQSLFKARSRPRSSRSLVYSAHWNLSTTVLLNAPSSLMRQTNLDNRVGTVFIVISTKLLKARQHLRGGPLAENVHRRSLEIN